MERESPIRCALQCAVDGSPCEEHLVVLTEHIGEFIDQCLVAERHSDVRHVRSLNISLCYKK